MARRKNDERTVWVSSTRDDKRTKITVTEQPDGKFSQKVKGKQRDGFSSRKGAIAHALIKMGIIE